MPKAQSSVSRISLRFNKLRERDRGRFRRQAGSLAVSHQNWWFSTIGEDTAPPSQVRVQDSEKRVYQDLS